MTIDKSLLTGSATILILKLLDEKNMYGYQMIEELRKKSNNIFELKAGTLYPLLHTLEQKGMLTSYEETVDNARVRKYYSITNKGCEHLNEKKKNGKHLPLLYMLFWEVQDLRSSKVTEYLEVTGRGYRGYNSIEVYAF